MKKPYKHAQVVTRLKARIAEAGSQTAFAKQEGLSQAYVSDVLNGRREAGPRMLIALRCEGITLYRDIA